MQVIEVEKAKMKTSLHEYTFGLMLRMVEVNETDNLNCFIFPNALHVAVAVVAL
jgi:hypothetical protein